MESYCVFPFSDLNLWGIWVAFVLVACHMQRGVTGWQVVVLAGDLIS